MSASIRATSVRRLTIPLAFGGTALGLAVAYASYALHGGGIEGLVMAARYTARLSFILFLVVFLISPLMRIGAAPLLRSALRERRGLGLAFAGAHFVHLAALIAVIVASGEDPALLTVVFGGFGYVLLAAMAATSNDAAVRALGPARWRALHSFGLYYLWFIFAVTYLRRVMGRAEMPEYWVLLAIAVAALVFRVAAGRRPRFALNTPG